MWISRKAAFVVLTCIGLAAAVSSCKKKETTAPEPTVYVLNRRALTFFSGWTQNAISEFGVQSDTTQRDTLSLNYFKSSSVKLQNKGASGEDVYRQQIDFTYQGPDFLGMLRGQLYDDNKRDILNLNGIVDGLSFTNSITLDTTNTVSGPDSAIVNMMIGSYIAGSDTFSNVLRVEMRNLTAKDSAGNSYPLSLGMYYAPRIGLVQYNIILNNTLKRSYFLRSSGL